MTSATKRWPRPTILLVEDDEMVRGVIANMLQGYGYRVITAADGAAAWELLQTSNITVAAIVTDVVMPKMDGVELAQKVSTLPHSPPLILISGYPRGDINPDYPFLPKPFQPDQLAALVAQLISGVEPAIS